MPNPAINAPIAPIEQNLVHIRDSTPVHTIGIIIANNIDAACAAKRIGIASRNERETNAELALNGTKMAGSFVLFPLIVKDWDTSLE